MVVGSVLWTRCELNENGDYRQETIVVLRGSHMTSYKDGLSKRMTYYVRLRIWFLTPTGSQMSL